jgi:glycosyltransferase involved in cell wall biosynthesis
VRPPVIAIDASSAAIGGGLTYLREMLPRLLADPRIELGPVLLGPSAAAAVPLPDGVHTVVLPGRWSALRRRWSAAVRSSGAEAVFVPTALSFRSYPIPMVIALRDVLMSPANTARRPPRVRARHAVHRGLARVTAGRSVCCIAVSEEAAAVAIHTLAIPSRRVAVIYHGGPDAVAPPRPPRPVKRLLFVSNIYRHKNLHLVIEALGHVSQPLDLTVVGRVIDQAYDAELLALVDAVPAWHQVSFVGPLYDDDLAREYDDADCFIWPSLAEAFGLPLLEAFGHGLPVLAGDTRSSREIIGDGASYFDPRDPGSLADALRRAATEGLSRGPLPRDYSWDAAAKRTAEVLERAARPDG